MNKNATTKQTIQTLKLLGLTSCQAKIYFTLATLGVSPVSKISAKSNIDRAEIYRIMPKLQKLGLVEKILAIPIEFKPMSLKNGLAILLKDKNVENLKLQKEVKRAIMTCKKDNRKTTHEQQKQFSITPGKDAHLNWLKNKLKSIHKTNDAIMTWSDNKRVEFFCEKEIQTVNERRIKTRIIIYLPEKERNAASNNQQFIDSPCIQRRFITNQPDVLGGVFDNEEVVIATTFNNPLQSGENYFWSSHPTVITLFQNYFEKLWKEAQIKYI
ncbi:MAG: hypothetical protein NWF06_04800 [Candidatus Bathyarchaeota archaeon]|nr:hypothetical protein [Candidatus Bathyarchaeum sp.]